MAERITVDGETFTSVGFVGAYTNIDDDPDSPDGNWLTHDDATDNKTLLASFASPTGGNPTAGADLQEFRVLLRKVNSAGTPDAGGGDPAYSIYLYEEGAEQSLLGSAGTITTTGEVVSRTWDASGLAGIDGSQVEIYVTVDKAGGGPNQRWGEIGAIEWNATVSATGAGEYTYSLSLMGVG